MKRMRDDIPTYDEQYDHTKWDEHDTRVRITLTLADKYIRKYHCATLMDLSCGDGAIPLGLKSSSGMTCVELGDIVHGDHLTVVGPIEESIQSIGDSSGDLFICTETLEHLDDPVSILREISCHTEYILITTPVNETLEHGNYQHIWSWTPTELKSLIKECGFDILHYVELGLDFYTYGFIWAKRTSD